MPKWPKISKANSIESCIYKLQLGLFVWNSMKVLHACKKEIYHGKFRSSVSSIVSARNTLPRGQVKNAPILIFFSVSSPWLHIWPRQIDVIISWLFHFQFRSRAVLIILFVYEFQLSTDQNGFHRQTNPTRPPCSCFINQLQISSAHPEPSTFKIPSSVSGHQGQVHSLWVGLREVNL